MCGFVGVFRRDGRDPDLGTVNSLNELIQHRGPNDSGDFTEGPLAMAFCRLSILDLSPAGHQPMFNDDQSLVTVYNGEVYNFCELRAELERAGHEFFSKTDTEVVLRAYEQWGEDAVKRLNGMFAFAIYDRRKKRLFLARDRFGVKPLYYYAAGPLFVFSSEVKAIVRHPDVPRDINPIALREYFTYENVMADETLFKGVRHLPSGSTLMVDASGVGNPKRYWQYSFADELAEPAISEEAAAEEVQRLFVQSVRRQLVSDVPVGSYLSGGMDSGAITAVAAQEIDHLATFTCGFDTSEASGRDAKVDERKAAEEVATRYNTEHYEIVLHSIDLIRIIERLTWHIDDPRLAPCYQNFYIARLAGKFVRVVLAGAGGDELFGGYPWRYDAGRGAKTLADFEAADFVCRQRVVPVERQGAFFSDDVRRAAQDADVFDRYRALYQDYRGGDEGPMPFLNRSLYFDLTTYLKGLFTLEDRIGMAQSMEIRVPFLDNDLVDYALRLPRTFKVRRTPASTGAEGYSSEGKYILRRAMKGVLGDQTLTRTKQGFVTPERTWFRTGNLKFVRDLFTEKKFAGRDYFQMNRIRDMLEEHADGRVDHHQVFWALINFHFLIKHFQSSRP